MRKDRVRALLGSYRSQPAQKTAKAIDVYMSEADAVLQRHGGRPFGPMEAALRRRLARRFGNSAIWRLPTAIRQTLEDRELVFRTTELVWQDNGWVANYVYFV